MFPLILLQAKAGGFSITKSKKLPWKVSINSPSGEGGGKKEVKNSVYSL